MSCSSSSSIKDKSRNRRCFIRSSQQGSRSLRVLSRVDHQNGRGKQYLAPESIQISTIDHEYVTTLAITSKQNPIITDRLDHNDGRSTHTLELPNIDRNNNSSERFEFSYENHDLDTEKDMTPWQAGWNVTNAIQGMSLVSLPYSILHGGYWGIVSLILCSYICCHTGKILVECLYEIDKKTGKSVRVRNSYVEIAQRCFGVDYGGMIINAAQIIELIMTCILYVVLCGDLMIGTFPDGLIDMRSWMMLSGVTLLPCAFMNDLKSVSITSLWCTVIHFIINATIFGFCFTRFDHWYLDKIRLLPSFTTFPMCLGIVVFSYTSQIFLPSLEGNMSNPIYFNRMLDWSHIAAAICKSLFAYVCFVTFGDATEEVITNNLPSGGFRGLVNLTLVVKALLSYPLPYYAAGHLLENTFFKTKPTHSHPAGVGAQPFNSMRTINGKYKLWAIALRILLVLVTLSAAISIPHFALLLGFIGSFTGTMLSFVWPCYFHMYLKWKYLEWRAIFSEIVIICLGVFFGITGMYSSLIGLITVNSSGSSLDDYD